MRGRQIWRRRGFAVAAVALTLGLVAPALAAPAALAAGRRPLSAAAKAKLAAAIRAKANTPEGRAKIAQYRAAQAKGQAQAPSPTTKKKKGTAATPAQKRQRALAARKAAQKRAAQRALIARQRAAENEESSLSLPLIALLAIAPFVLIGLYLLGADYLRRPRKRGGGTGGASLEITRVDGR